MLTNFNDEEMQAPPKKAYLEHIMENARRTLEQKMPFEEDPTYSL